MNLGADVASWPYAQRMQHAELCAVRLAFFHGIRTARSGSYEQTEKAASVQKLKHQQLVEIAEAESAIVAAELRRMHNPKPEQMERAA